MRIIDLHGQTEAVIQQAALLLVAGFRAHWPPAWPDMASALAEMEEALAADNICRAALDEAGNVLGWVGAIKQYPYAWEMHPLVVHPDQQRQGIGRALVADLEQQVRKQGGMTIYLGTDDEDGSTTLSGTDLYPDVTAHISTIRNLNDHPYEFYQKQGFVIVGVIPDANGPGKPDILMAKRIAREVKGEKS